MTMKISLNVKVFLISSVKVKWIFQMKKKPTLNDLHVVSLCVYIRFLDLCQMVFPFIYFYGEICMHDCIIECLNCFPGSFYDELLDNS